MYRTFGRFVLGLETGIDGGSLSILDGNRTIDSVSGSGNISKSEDLLFLLENLLQKNDLGKRDFGLIAVSDAPGSATGLRIGLAIAKGLGGAFSAKVRKISILDAMATRAERQGIVICALATKRNGIYFRKYLSKDGEIRTLSAIENKREIDEFAEEMKDFRTESLSVICNEGLRQALSVERELIQGEIFIYPFEESLAEILATASTSKTRPITQEP